MSDDVVIVTGGTSGIGAAVVPRLLDAGAAIVVLDIGDKADELSRQNCADHLNRAHFRKVDITDEPAVA